jgi:tetratricopeptide (TPR) repeat protein
MHLVRITQRVNFFGRHATHWTVGFWLLACPVAIWMASGCMSMRHQKIVPESVAACRQLARDGISAMELGNTSQACTLLGNAVETSPTDIDARRQLAEALWLEGRQQEAVVHMEAAVRLDPTHAPTLVRAGEMLLASGNDTRAFERAEQAIRVEPTLAGAWKLRGRIFHQRNDLPHGLADLQQALHYAPQDSQVLLEVAEIQYQLQRPQRSLTTLHHLLDHCPPGAEPQRALWLEGLAYGKLARPQDAMESLLAATEHGPAQADLLYALAQAEVAAGFPGRATQSVRRALTVDRQHQASRTLLAQLTVQGDTAKESVLRR